MQFRAFGAALLRSITPATMSVAFGLGAAAPALSTVVAEGMFGRPSSTSVIAIPFGVMFGVAGAALSSRVTSNNNLESEQRNRRQYSNEQFGVFAAQHGHPV